MKRNKGRGREILDFREQFREAIDYIKESMRYVYFVIAVFFGFALIGFLYSEEFWFIEILLRDIIAQTEGLGGTDLTFFIMQNNLKSAFFGLVFGVFLGIFPFFSAASNGLVLGYVSSIVVIESSFFELWRLLPHGIFELAAVFVSLGMGVRLGFGFFSINGRDLFRERFVKSINVFLFFVVPLLIAAAVIEGVLIALEI